MALIFAPAFATNDIASDANSASCTQPVLGTYEGATNFEAKWSPNPITLKWYDGYNTTNNEVTPANDTAEECTYDGGLTIPSNPPSRNGYNFAGWTVRSGNSGGNSGSGNSGSGGACALTASTLNSLEGNDSGYITDSRGEYGADSDNADTYGLTADNTWATEFTDGTIIKGIASCNNTEGEDSGVPMQNAQFTTTDTGQYCWCKATSYNPSVGEACDVSVASLWVFSGAYRSSDDCAYDCAVSCADVVQAYAAFRAGMFGVVAQ